MLPRVACAVLGSLALVASACDSRPAYPLDDDMPADAGLADASDDGATSAPADAASD